MRYEDWDVLLFPRDCKIPVKEFKVACHVVHDAGWMMLEFAPARGSYGLPTVTSFVPSLPAGAPFQVSIHSWSLPTVSQFTRSYSKYADSVQFEARLFIDGNLVASTSLSRTTSWPHVIAHSFDFSKNGDLEGLKFPAFRQELLQQNYWSPADDLGRIKVIISEGFPRDSISMPIERVKNVAAFSFQHAPTEILEGSCIAWPNPSMWRRTPFTSSMPVPSLQSQDADAHAHSPRRRTGGLQAGSPVYSMPLLHSRQSSTMSRESRRCSQQPLSLSTASGASTSDPFAESNAYFEWLNGMGMGMDGGEIVGSTGPTAARYSRSKRKTSADINMQDYLSNGPTPMLTEQQFALSNLPTDDEGNIAHWKVPTNTPTTSGAGNCDADAIPFPLLPHNAYISPDLANTLTTSLLNHSMPVQLQNRAYPYHSAVPAPEVRSRKENRLQQLGEPSPSTVTSTPTSIQDHHEMRKVSQQLYIPSGSTLSVSLSSHESSPQSVVGHGLGAAPIEDLGISTNSSSGPELALTPISGNSRDKGTKRARNATSTSVKILEDEDEPRRPSPSVRIAKLNAEDQEDDTF
ncbi:hypothetical protein HJFPF1_06048 [Paramyrothecium foliicola]|nr:hypothetical protein HJFPF1_06048 [Paramyrothecium foliicola]